MHGDPVWPLMLHCWRIPGKVGCMCTRDSVCLNGCELCTFIGSLHVLCCCVCMCHLVDCLSHTIVVHIDSIQSHAMYLAGTLAVACLGSQLQYNYCILPPAYEHFTYLACLLRQFHCAVLLVSRWTSAWVSLAMYSLDDGGAAT